MRRTETPCPARNPRLSPRPLGPALLVAAVLAASCAQAPRLSVDWTGGPFFTPENFTGAAEMPVDVLRVAVLPPAGLEGLTPEGAAGLQEALLQALGATGRFEVVPVDPEKVRAIAGKATVNSTEALSPDLFSRLAQDHAADAVLLTDITLYRPYAPLALGVRSKLARTGGNRAVLWAFDTVFDTRNPAVLNSARRHASGGIPPAQSEPAAIAVQSPSRFAAYAFSSSFATLPQRYGTAPRKAKVPAAAAD